jgi:hypothetical protein
MCVGTDGESYNYNVEVRSMGREHSMSGVFLLVFLCITDETAALTISGNISISREQFDVGGSRRFFDGRRSREQPCVKSATVAAKTAGAWKADDVLLSSSRIQSIDRSIDHL